MGLKEIYYSLEDKYYAFLDRLNESIPVYKVIDPIDRIVPSFALFSAIFLLILIAVLYIIFSSFLPVAKGSLSVVVKSQDGEPLQNATVLVSGQALEFPVEEKTNKSGRALVEELEQGKEYSVEVEKRNYRKATETVVLDEAEKLLMVELERETPPPSPITIEFTDSSGKKMDGRTIQVHFSCTNSQVALLQADFSVTSGEITITPPEECGLLSVRATASGFKPLEAIIDRGGKVLRFEAEETAKGSILFVVRDSETDRLLNGIKVSVFDLQDFPVGAPRFTDRGEAVFSIEPGSYKAIIEDESSDYGSEEVSFSVQERESSTREVELSKQVKAFLNVSVIEGSSGEELNGASIFVRKENGARVASKELEEDESTAIFALTDSGVYIVSASKEGFLVSSPVRVDTTGLDLEEEVDVVIELEQCTPTTCGIIRVKVEDEEGLTVENAVVYLLDPATGFLLSEYGSKVTDANGLTSAFTNVKEGSYKATAQKYPASGTSNALEVDMTAENIITVVMVIGDGTIEVIATDLDGREVPFALAELRTHSGEVLGTISLDEEGKGSLSTKADKRVYAIVTADGFSRFVSNSRQVFRNEKVTINAVLEREISGDKATVRWFGLFDESGNRIEDALGTGETYIARFQLLVPENNDFFESGLHVRVGEKRLLENDMILIAGINAPETTIVKGTSFTPETGTNEDYDNLTNADAKWANIVWIGETGEVEGGIYNVEVELKVKRETTPGFELPVFYRAWALSDFDGYVRDPVDARLGNSESTSARHALYAEAYKQPFFEGATQLCDENFCYSERVVDLSEGLILKDTPYEARVFSDYIVLFSITNNSSTRHDNATLHVLNEDTEGNDADVLGIEDYNIVNADSELFSSSTRAFEIGPIGLGNFSPFRSVNSDLLVRPRKMEDSNLRLRIVSAGNEVLEKRINFTVVSESDLNVIVEPDTLPAFLPIDLLVKVRFKEGNNAGLPAARANVIVSRIAPDRSESSSSKKTDAAGNALFQICQGNGCSPSTKVRIEVQLAGYGSEVIEKEITARVLSVSPEEIVSNLDLTEVTEERINLNLKNLVPKTVKVSNVRISGAFNGLLELQQMNNFVQGSLPLEIEREQTKALTVLTSLSEQAQLIDAPVEVRGSLLLDVEEETLGVTWSFDVPLTVAINLAQPPSNGDCLIIEGTEVPNWRESTEEKVAINSFSITNSCITESNRPMDLKDLQATIDWTGEDGVVGQVELTVVNPETGESRSEILQESIWSELLPSIPAEQQFLATLKFLPKPSQRGKKAEFRVEIRGGLLTNRGEQAVNANETIDAELHIINLSECINFEPNAQEGLDLGTNESGEFTIDTAECGEIDLDLRFCNNDSECSGGTGRGITIAPSAGNKVTVNAGETFTLAVERGAALPGIYGIPVEARPPGGSWRQVAVLDVLIDPMEGEAFTLNRYDFILIGENAKDSVTLSNKWLEEGVSVNAGVCDWEEATDSLEFSGIGAIVGGAAGIGIGYLALAAFCLPCALVGAVIGALLPGLFGEEDKCDPNLTQNLVDWVINLAGTEAADETRSVPPDARDITVSDDRISAEWKLDITDVRSGGSSVPPPSGEFVQGFTDKKQDVGVIFTNSGLDESTAIYSIATFNALEHIHGDSTHAAPAVNCRAGNFGFYWIGGSDQGNCSPVSERNYSQSFHLRFKSRLQEETLPPVQGEMVACSTGTKFGRTGQDALPRVKLNWSWVEPAGIGVDSCDFDNPDYIYCDATQFTIELNKKIHRLYRFLEEQSFILECPSTPQGLEVTPEMTARGCWLERTTEVRGGVPQIIKFLDANPDISEAEKDEIRKLLKFKAYLVKDAYTTDFKQDFAKYYSETEFADADSYFTSIGSNSIGETYGFSKLFTESGAFNYTTKYTEQNFIQTPGLYEVELALFFGNDWRFFDEEGNPTVKITAVLLNIDDPFPNSPFYYTPFDGRVGIEGDDYHRQGYGVSYDLAGSEGLVNINNGPPAVQALTDIGSNPVVELDARIESGFFELNASPETRGSLLILENDGTQGGIVLQPARATPLLLKISSDATDEAFGAYYKLFINDTQTWVGNSLNYWSGAGACLDFSGVPVNEAFDERPDRLATEADAVLNWQNTYTVQWNEVLDSGDVYLQTIFYTDPLSNSVITVEEPKGSMEFITPDEQGASVSLNGISSMPYNNYAGGSVGNVGSIQDVFELVKQEEICITSSGTQASFWWNPKTIYEQPGTSRSIHQTAQELEAGASCIGYS